MIRPKTPHKGLSHLTICTEVTQHVCLVMVRAANPLQYLPAPQPSSAHISEKFVFLRSRHSNMAKPTSSTAIIPTITDQSSIQALNWGPVTSLFIPPASCTATITDPQGAKPVMFFGHENDPYFDLSCYPTGTMSSLELAKYRDKWAMYYCKQTATIPKMLLMHAIILR